METDEVTKIGNSVIQHGPLNDRVYLIKLAGEDLPGIVRELDSIASSNKYGKIFAKVPSYARDVFSENGYCVEAHIHCFYNGVDDVYFMAKYFSESRRRVPDREKIKEVLLVAKSKAKQGRELTLSDGLEFKIRGGEDAVEVAQVYSKVFETYPFPIKDSRYIKESMGKDIKYFSIQDHGRIIALSSAEVDYSSGTAELTDFATLPGYRGNNLAGYLLQAMEDMVFDRSVKTCYSIARALSYGMNIVFARNNYEYAGTLINNTNISGRIESMNVWYKSLL